LKANRTLGILKHRLEYDIKIEIRWMGCEMWSGLMNSLRHYPVARSFWKRVCAFRFHKNLLVMNRSRMYLYNRISFLASTRE
jgi:hypothetical protein